MIAAILCPGPSLSQWIDSPPKADVTIAINAAARVCACDWWAMGDAEVISWWPEVLPTVGVFHQDTYWHRFTASDADLRSRTALHWDDVRCPAPFNGMVWHSTLPAAIGLAHWLKATRVDVYGCDWEGSIYFDGQEGRHGPADKRPGRWQQEFHDTFETLNRCNISFTRHLSEALSWTP